MVFGPCGGVRADSTCEMAPQPCPFARDPPPVTWPSEAGTDGTGTAESQLLAAAERGPVVVTDLTLPAFDRDAVTALTGVLRDSCDALLVGEHQNRPDFPPTLMAALIRDAGGVPWVTLTCRDRNRLVLEQDLAGLRVVGTDGVLCVTGDGRAHGVRRGVTQVFDLDGTQLAALANQMGLPVAVPESPAAPPLELRPGRLVQKQRAGAHVAFLNHVSNPGDVARFVSAARELGLTMPVVAAVAVFTDEVSARVLQRFPGLHLDEQRVEAVLSAGDPRTAGIEAAVAEADRLLEIDGVAGVNLSGLASGGGELAGAEVKAEIGLRVKGER
jgi:methylenetetrahydrofolate reductase (NADPH)